MSPVAQQQKAGTGWDARDGRKNNKLISSTEPEDHHNADNSRSIKASKRDNYSVTQQQKTTQKITQHVSYNNPSTGSEPVRNQNITDDDDVNKNNSRWSQTTIEERVGKGTQAVTSSGVSYWGSPPPADTTHESQSFSSAAFLGCLHLPAPPSFIPLLLSGRWVGCFNGL